MASREPVRSLPLRRVRRVELSELTRPRGAAVAMILVPEAVAFAFMAGLKPLVGLQAAWIMCLIAGLLGDRPAMISGATGAVAYVLPVITQVNLCDDYLVKREMADQQPPAPGGLWSGDMFAQSNHFTAPKGDESLDVPMYRWLSQS